MRMAQRMLTGVALLSILGVGLTGCKSGTESVQEPSPTSSTAKELSFRESQDSTVDLEDETGNPLPMTGDNWRQLDSGDIEITLHGGSSCPPAVEKIVEEENTIQVTLKKLSEGRACTADYRSFYVIVNDAGDVRKVEIFSNTDGNGTELPKR